MLANYLKLGLRILLRNRFFTFINILGLSLGFAVFFILWQYSQRELHSDQFHKGFERIFRFGVMHRYSDSDGSTKTGKLAAIDPAIAGRAGRELADVEEFTRVFIQRNFTKEHIPFHGQEIFLSYADENNNTNSFPEFNVSYADPNFFSFFNFPLKQGRPEEVLNEPYSVVLSESTALKYFGDQDPFGKTVLLNDSLSLKVTGVFKDLPSNTHLTSDVIISSLTIEKYITRVSIANGGVYCYLRLRPDANVASFERAIKGFTGKWYDPVLKNVCATCSSEAYLQPLREIPFSKDYWYDFFSPKSKYLLVALSAISMVILIMAWINYVNLSISASHRRVKELAARKTVGAKPLDFVLQFVAEAFLINCLSLCLALGLIQMLRSPVQLMLGFYVPTLAETSLSTIGIMLTSFLVGILLTGIYPALLTLQNSPRVLFGKLKSFRSGNVFSKLLTTVQYSFAIILIVWIFAVFLQLEFVLHKDLGIRKEHVVTVDLPFIRPANFGTLLNSFSEQLMTIPGVRDRSMSHSAPGVVPGFVGIEKEGKYYAPQTNGAIDEQFIPLYGIRLLAGRNFLRENPPDQHAVIISRITARQMGITDPAEAIGQNISVSTAEWGNAMAKAEIIGVIEDYKVDPLFSNTGNNKDGIILTYKNYLTTVVTQKKLSVLIETADVQKTMGEVEALFKATFSGNVFNWDFLDHQITRAYNQEKTTRNQISFFTIIAIGIACLGLLGMITNKAAEKTKEIGVRKVLGADFHHLGSVLLGATFAQLIFSALIGIPAAGYLTQRYLENFSERITLHWWHFGVPIFILLIIMLVTTASTIVKASRTNPVDALRYD